MEENVKISADRKRKIRNERNYFLPILQILRDYGGSLTNMQELDNLLPNYTDFTNEEINYTEKAKSGKYRPYWIGRNFAVKNLAMAGYINYVSRGELSLTEKGRTFDLANFDLDRDIYAITLPMRKKKKKRKQVQKSNKVEVQESEGEEAENLEKDDWKEAILQKLTEMDPYDFEAFVRGLLRKMGFMLDQNLGVSKSNDGGLDGYAYNVDEQSLRTTRVAIQCKRFDGHPVGSHDIDNLRGAVGRHNAEYGVFVTTSYFSNSAIENSKQGTTAITLIDGQKLVDLLVKYDYKVRKVEVFELYI